MKIKITKAAAANAARMMLLASVAWLSGCGGLGRTTAMRMPPPLPNEGRLGVVGDDRELPPVQREFRAAWVATVGNIDWPSRPGLSTEQQQAELRAIVERAARLHLNALIFQVRPGCDAVYKSNLEPWAECLTGRQGEAPAPAYDPLAYAIELAHDNGLELHAWINPFRARPKDERSASAANHVSRTRPSIVRVYGNQLWLDPGEPAARDHSLRVIADIVRRYDVDGVHIDDYFYPYPVKDAAGKPIPFPDDAGFQRYRDGGGHLSRDDWRRDNINQFVRQMYETVHRTRPDVQVGISPFGIWRPGNPQGIRGMDAFQNIYADSKLWLTNGWCDYFTPQLYWRIEQTEQSFPALLAWWLGQNPRGRHIWPGSFISQVGGKWPASEITEQVRITREKNAGGAVFFSMRALMNNRGGLSDALLGQTFQTPALPPATPWLDATPPLPPQARAIPHANNATLLAWRPRDLSDLPAHWIIRIRHGGEWRVTLLPGSLYRFTAPPGPNNAQFDFAAISAVDRLGNISPPTVFR
ncbi:MAG: family 10 glycosylhydrolase [Planctomycetes bacterium]|nr:family 10 glycosylhydrolase [Planctomycetota bacterium]